MGGSTMSSVIILDFWQFLLPSSCLEFPPLRLSVIDYGLVVYDNKLFSFPSCCWSRSFTIAVETRNSTPLKSDNKIDPGPLQLWKRNPEPYWFAKASQNEEELNLFSCHKGTGEAIISVWLLDIQSGTLRDKKVVLVLQQMCMIISNPKIILQLFCNWISFHKIIHLCKCAFLCPQLVYKQKQKSVHRSSPVCQVYLRSVRKENYDPLKRTRKSLAAVPTIMKNPEWN